MNGIQTITTKDNDVQLARKLNENFSYLQAVGGGGDVDTSQIDKKIVVINNAVSENNEAVRNFNQAIIKYLTTQYLVSGTVDADSVLAEYLNAENLEAHVAHIEELNATVARIDSLEADHVTTEQLEAATARIASIESNYVKTATLEADYITAEDIDATYITADKVESDYLKSNWASVKNLIAEDGWITDGMMGNISASHITSGTISAALINAGELKVKTINGIPLDNNNTLEELFTAQDKINKSLQNQVDGAIETWTGTTKPTKDTKPWSSGTDESHVGDIYFVVGSTEGSNGYCYRWASIGESYDWVLIEDSDVTAALGKIDSLESFKSEATETLNSVSSSITTLSGTIDATNSKIDTTISKVGEIETKESTLSANLSSFKKETETNLDSKVSKTTYDTKIAELVASDSGLSSKVSEIIAEDGSFTKKAKSEITQTAGSIMSSVSVVDSNGVANETKFEQSASGFTWTIDTSGLKGDKGDKGDQGIQGNPGYTPVKGTDYFTSSEIASIETNASNTAINSIEVGGRNLLTGSQYLDRGHLKTWNASAFEKTSDKYESCTVVKGTFPAEKTDTHSYVDSNALLQSDIYNTLFVSGDSLTVSFWAKTDTNNTEVRIHLHNDGAIKKSYINGVLSATSSDGFASVVLSTEWKRYSVTWVFNSDQTRLATLILARLYTNYRANIYNTAGACVYLAGYKLEKGNKATDWTPAPEDVDSAINDKSKTFTEAPSSTTDVSVGDGWYQNGSYYIYAPESEPTTYPSDLVYPSGEELASTGWQVVDGDGGKTATNFLDFTEENGLVVGNLTDDILNGNVQLTSEPAVNLRNGNLVLASFKENSVTLSTGACKISYNPETGNTSLKPGAFERTEDVLGYKLGECIATFKETASASSCTSLLSSISYVTSYSAMSTDNMYRICFNKNYEVEAVCSALVEYDLIERAQPNFVYTPLTPETPGLVIGNEDDNNILIDDDSVDIRNGSTVNASFGADKVELGKNSKTAAIEMQGGSFNIETTEVQYPLSDDKYYNTTMLCENNLMVKSSSVPVYSSGKSMGALNLYTQEVYSGVSQGSLSNWTSISSTSYTSAGILGNSSIAEIDLTTGYNAEDNSLVKSGIYLSADEITANNDYVTVGGNKYKIFSGTTVVSSPGGNNYYRLWTTSSYASNFGSYDARDMFFAYNGDVNANTGRCIGMEYHDGIYSLWNDTMSAAVRINWTVIKYIG